MTYTKAQKQHSTPWVGQARRQPSPRRRRPWTEQHGAGKEEGHGDAARGSLQIPAPPPPPGGAKGKGKKADGASVLASAAGTAAKTQLSALVAALTVHQESLPDKVRQIVHAHQETNASAQARALHRHVSAQATAAKQLASLRARRSQYLASWKEYVKKLGESLQKQIQEKTEVLIGFDSEEAVLLDTMETAKATALSLAGGEASATSENTMDLDAAAAEFPAEDREKLKRQEDALVQAIGVMKEDADKEMIADAAKTRDGSRTPRRKSRGDAASISSEEEGSKSFEGIMPENSQFFQEAAFGETTCQSGLCYFCSDDWH